MNQNTDKELEIMLTGRKIKDRRLAIQVEITHKDTGMGWIAVGLIVAATIIAGAL